VEQPGVVKDRLRIAPVDEIGVIEAAQLVNQLGEWPHAAVQRFDLVAQLTQLCLRVGGQMPPFVS
jgi:hypothetical protein